MFGAGSEVQVQQFVMYLPPVIQVDRDLSFRYIERHYFLMFYVFELFSVSFVYVDA